MTLGKKTAGKSRDSRGLKKKTLTKARKNGTTSKEKKVEYAARTSTIPDTSKLVNIILKNISFINTIL